MNSVNWTLLLNSLLVAGAVASLAVGLGFAQVRNLVPEFRPADEVNREAAGALQLRHKATAGTLS